AHEFLPAANGYLLRQDWEEGFATAVHLVLDLDTGEYERLSAGHLHGMERLAGAGRRRFVLSRVELQRLVDGWGGAFLRVLPRQMAVGGGRERVRGRRAEPGAERPGQRDGARARV
ncbi:hypothetical protein, partial [Saccharothrix sp. ST-888]|uniref:hypothetical protein n=1 Tax=Saccharothrix sp. ST-888 TaxID=1427391 RepID=UPI0005EC9171